MRSLNHKPKLMKFIIGNEIISYSVGLALASVYVLMLVDFFVTAFRNGFPGFLKSAVLLLSSVNAVLLVASGIISYDALYSSYVLEAALPAVVLLAYHLDSGGRLMDVSVMAVTAIVFTISLILSMMRFFTDGIPSYLTEFSAWLPAVLALSMLMHSCFRMMSGITDLRELLKGMQVGRYVSEFMTSSFISVFLSVLILAMSSFMLSGVAHSICAGVCLAAVVFMHVSLYVKVSRGRIFVMCRKLEDKLKHGTSLRIPEREPEDGMSKADIGYRTTYERLNTLFEEKKPYLDGNLTIGDIARELYTNKLYISKSINLYTGKNFCQYVNLYRVRHSMKLFKANPHLKVGQLAEMSGFHSVASYNMAFRLFMNESPGEWCRRNRFTEEE